MRLSSSIRLILTACLLGAAACSGSEARSSSDGSSGAGTGGSGGSGGGPSETPEFRGECASSEEIGFFIVQHETDYSVVSGEVLGGVVPSKILTEVGKEGDCTLLQRKNPFCDPPCAPGDACDQSGKCVPYPLMKSVGDVAITGLE